jgi:hypothetical protein
MSDYVKKDDLGFVVQLNNFKNKLSNYATVLGLDPAVLTNVSNDSEFMGFAVTSIDTSKTYAQGWTSLKDDARNGKGTTPIGTFPSPVDVTTPPTAVDPGIEDRFRALVRQIKANPAYNNTMGEDLGIVAPEDTAVSLLPVLTIKLDAGKPVISFKKGKSDGIRLYSKRAGEDAFSFLAVDTHSPYTDTRVNLIPGTSEKREYYAYFFKNDEEYGDQSAVASVSVS